VREVGEGEEAMVAVVEGEEAMEVVAGADTVVVVEDMEVEVVAMVEAEGTIGEVHEEAGVEAGTGVGTGRVRT
jgi:hypothetical protein